jgi:hybrid polyketide synthase/nonribosomal peptide synthetase ACE1
MTHIILHNPIHANLSLSDIRNRDDMNSVYQTIKNTLPAVAGLVSGAMVLRDTAIRDMCFEQMTTVLKPRVDGNLHLDQLFHNENLDFFILLSSMTGVLGNIGQSNYTTSNAFMASLAAHRRQRGLAASVINVGAIVDAGFVTREVSEIADSSLARAGMMWLSEETSIR